MLEGTFPSSESRHEGTQVVRAIPHRGSPHPPRALIGVLVRWIARADWSLFMFSTQAHIHPADYQSYQIDNWRANFSKSEKRTREKKKKRANV